jgi:hypothetical protein
MLGISNEYFKAASNTNLPNLLAHILETTINYGVQLKNVNIGMINTIIKDNTGDHTSLDNTRPITVSETISVIIEIFILKNLQKSLNLHSSQFGFRQASSTSHAIFVMKTIIEDLKRKKKTGFAIFLDYSKAFDKINRNKMFNKLILKLKPHIWLFLWNYYSVAKVVIKIDENNFSSPFEPTVGVKQGGNLSPSLFNCVIDELLRLLETENNSYKIASDETEEIVLGIVVYADDTNSIADNEEKAQKNLDIIEKYCDLYDIKINVKKTKWMWLGKKENNKESELVKKLRQLTEPRFHICKLDIERVHKFKFLGCEISSDGSNKAHISKRKSIAITAIAGLKELGIENPNMPPEMKGLLINSFLRSKLMYAMECSNLNKEEINELKKFEGNLIKKINNLSTHCKTRHVLYAMNLCPIELALIKRKLGFTIQLLMNELTSKIVLARKSEMIEEVIQYVGHAWSQTPYNKNAEKIKIIIKIKEKLKTIYNIEKTIKESNKTKAVQILLKKRTFENNDALHFILEPG